MLHLPQSLSVPAHLPHGFFGCLGDSVFFSLRSIISSLLVATPGD